MLTFPQQTSTAGVQLTPSVLDFHAATVCLRSITDLGRDYSLFSLATTSQDNAFMLYWKPSLKLFHYHVRSTVALFGTQDYKPNEWHSICLTWDSGSGLVQLWLDGKPSIRKHDARARISQPSIILGQDQDNYGGGFDINQSFVGMLSDFHMWNYALSTCEIQRYMDDLNFTPGNELNWRALEFKAIGRVLIEDKQVLCQVKSS